jgi:segregation and condensation protein B
MSDTNNTSSPEGEALEGQDPPNTEDQAPEVVVEAEAETDGEVDAEAGGDGAGEPDANVKVDAQHLRLLEAVLFAALKPLTEDAISQRLPNDTPVIAALAQLQTVYENRGVNLVKAGGRWFFRTAEDLSEQLRVHMKVPRRLSRAAMETLAIIAYHQPVTRAEIEEIRGVGLSKGTLDALFEAGWIGPKGRRRTAGRPVTWGTTNGFLTTFGIDTIGDLPGLDDLKAAGLLDKRPAIQITDSQESQDDDEADPLEDEEPLEMDLLEEEGDSNVLDTAALDDATPASDETSEEHPQSEDTDDQNGAKTP